jgi:KTSC domain
MIKTAKLSGGQLKTASYDEKEQRLEIEFTDGSRKVFKAVQHEVFRRLTSSPNPASYYEDRIQEEYALDKLATRSLASTRSKLDDLFAGKA